MQVCGVLFSQVLQDLYDTFLTGRYSCMFARRQTHNKSKVAPQGEGERFSAKPTFKGSK
jgi:hypothetical protein